MTIIRSRGAGFCPGVKRAIDLCNAALDNGGKVYSLGALIHNPLVLAALKSRGLIVLEEGDIVRIDTRAKVIIRAHGAAPAIKRAIKERGGSIIDATCPRVASNIKKALDTLKTSRVIYIAGNREHAEVRAIKASIEDRGGICFVLSSSSDISSIPDDIVHSPAAIMSQTTILDSEYHDIKEALRLRIGETPLLVLDTICPATRMRIQGLKECAHMVPIDSTAAIVIGGKGSANTRRLYLIAKELFPSAYHIEGITDIDDTMLKALAGYKTVVLTAGASTPPDAIDQIEAKLKETLPSRE